MIYTSEIATKALGLKPLGNTHEGPDSVCAMCARPIHQGDLSQRKVLSRSFTDFPKLAPSDYICGYCNATARQEIMRELQRCVITEIGIYGLNTDEARSWLWTTPPKPPFAVVINHSTMAAFHYFWRTPVTLDADLITMNVDDVIYQVRRDRVMRALAYAGQLLAKAPALAKKKGVMKSPFLVLSRDPSKSARASNGRIHRDALELAEMFPECRPAVQFLQNLSPGELIALSPMVKQKPAAPVQPPLITAVSAKKTKAEHLIETEAE